jgi:lysophospholipase L1-like esterase
MAGEEEKTKVLFVGHSWMVGVAGEKGERFRRTMGKLPLEIDGTAKVGSTVGWAQAQLEKKNPEKYGVIVIFTGMNDVLGKKSADQIAKDLIKLYETAKSGGAKVFIFNLEPKIGNRKIEEKIESINKLLREKIPGSDLIEIVVITGKDKNKTLEKATNNWKNLHPNEKGYAWIRDNVRTIILEWTKNKGTIQGLVPMKIEPGEKKKPIPIPA